MNKEEAVRALIAVLLVAGAARAEGVREARPNIVELELGGRFGVGIGAGAVPCGNDLCNGSAVLLVPIFVSVNPLGDERSLDLSAGTTLAISSDGGRPDD